jgi:hypothetical protein
LSIYRKFDSDIGRPDGEYSAISDYEAAEEAAEEEDIDLSVLIGSGNAL